MLLSSEGRKGAALVALLAVKDSNQVPGALPHKSRQILQGFFPCVAFHSSSWELLRVCLGKKPIQLLFSNSCWGRGLWTERHYIVWKKVDIHPWFYLDTSAQYSKGRNRSLLTNRLKVKALSCILSKLCAVAAIELASQPTISALNDARKCSCRITKMWSVVKSLPALPFWHFHKVLSKS